MAFCDEILELIDKYGEHILVNVEEKYSDTNNETANKEDGPKIEILRKSDIIDWLEFHNCCGWFEESRIDDLKTEILDLPTFIVSIADKKLKAEVISRGRCMMCGKELTDGLFLCKECREKEESGEEANGCEEV